jgi:hypothetical protein
MRGGAECHMCGRCSGFRGAVLLAPRSPCHEIAHVAGLKGRSPFRDGGGEQSVREPGAI